MSAASPKRKLIWWALAGVFAVLLAVTAVWWTQNRAEIAEGKAIGLGDSLPDRNLGHCAGPAGTSAR